ncbi:MAG: hypothetical protein JJU11_14845, partial [Candidatus Sumerlaeia bacterium]|nr:hypothetical protein [Candidatus Sumerlaeia bacterium]
GSTEDCLNVSLFHPQIEVEFGRHHLPNSPCILREIQDAAILYRTDCNVVQRHGQPAAHRKQKQGLMQVLLTEKFWLNIMKGED